MARVVMPCCSQLLIGTNRMLGRDAASQIAAVASFLPLLPSHAVRGDEVRRDQPRIKVQRPRFASPVVRTSSTPSIATRQPAGNCAHQAMN